MFGGGEGVMGADATETAACVRVEKQAIALVTQSIAARLTSRVPLIMSSWVLSCKERLLH